VTEVVGKIYAAFGAGSVISILTLSDWTMDCCKKQLTKWLGTRSTVVPGNYGHDRRV